MFQTYEVTARPDEGPPRVAKLRDWMAAQGLDAFIVPRADMYQGEYVAPSDARLAWISGFTGSAGFAVITTDRAALFLDGRYTVQGRAQTDADTFEIVNWPATTLSAWLPTALADGATVGLDPWLHTVKEVDALRKLDTLQIIDSANGVDAIWTDRPAPPSAPMSAYPAALAGRDHTAKRTEIAAALVAGDVDAFLTTQPDAVAWLLNIRGADIERTPIAQAFALIHKDTHVDLICDPAKAAPVTAHLGPDIRVVPPEDAPALLARTPGTVGYDAATCPAALPDLMVRAKAMDDPIALPKACKSEAEIAATKTAHLRDAAAMCRFLRWLDEVPAGTTEIDVAKALEGFRRDSNALLDISFESIVGSGPNGAIVHYRVNEETNRALDQDSVLL
ncbi:MAG: aminopeptidase P family N-terminal domain-containing protein, partial [Pseudomonadota bacterium]